MTLVDNFRRDLNVSGMTCEHLHSLCGGLCGSLLRNCLGSKSWGKIALDQQPALGTVTQQCDIASRTMTAVLHRASNSIGGRGVRGNRTSVDAVFENDGISIVPDYSLRLT